MIHESAFVYRIPARGDERRKAARQFALIAAQLVACLIVAGPGGRADTP